MIQFSNDDVRILFDNIQQYNIEKINVIIMDLKLCEKNKLDTIFFYWTEEQQQMLTANIAGVALLTLLRDKYTTNDIYKFILADLIVKKLTIQKRNKIKSRKNIVINNINDVIDIFQNKYRRKDVKFLPSVALDENEEKSLPRQTTSKIKKNKHFFHHLTKRHLYFVNKKRKDHQNNKLRRRSHYENLLKKIDMMMKGSEYDASNPSTDRSLPKNLVS